MNLSWNRCKSLWKQGRRGAALEKPFDFKNKPVHADHLRHIETLDFHRRTAEGFHTGGAVMDDGKQIVYR
jgi:hypothetical protein